jgi:hypothetical protein
MGLDKARSTAAVPGGFALLSSECLQCYLSAHQAGRVGARRLWQRLGHLTKRRSLTISSAAGCGAVVAVSHLPIPPVTHSGPEQAHHRRAQ